jgi:hypothetical protein
MTVDEALETLRELADPTTIEGKAAYHKIDRPYIGTNNQILNDIGKEWRRALDLDQRIALARGLWDYEYIRRSCHGLKITDPSAHSPRSGGLGFDHQLGR